MAISYTKKMLVERIKRHIANGWPDEDFSATDNEVLLYVDQALASGLIGQTYANAKIEGNIAVPEAYLTTYQLSALQQNSITKIWYGTLPQPPVNLPLGYSITEAYFASSTNGKGLNVMFIEGKRVAYRKLMPMPFGVRAWVDGNIMWLEASDGGSLLNQTLYVVMASTRTSSVTDVMTLPDDAIEAIFMNVTQKLIQRMQLPQDIIKDDLPAGVKTS